MRNSTDRIRRATMLGAVALSAALLGACGGGIEGSYFYGEGGQGITLELRGGDTAEVSITGLGSTEGKYSVDGETVTVTMPDGDVDIFTIRDGNLETRWDTGPQSGREQVIVDLGEARALTAIVLALGPFSNDFPRDLQVQVSADGRDWAETWRGPVTTRTFGCSASGGVALSNSAKPLPADFFPNRDG